MLRELKSVRLEFLRSIDRTENLVKELIGGLNLSPHLVKPFVRNVTVGASRAHTRAALEMNRLLQLFVNVVAHFVAGNAERLGIRDFHGPVEAAPE